MSVNLLEEDRLVYHDYDADTLEITPGYITDSPALVVSCTNSETDWVESVYVDRDAVETLRDALTCWLETGKLTQSLTQEQIDQGIFDSLKKALG